MKWAVRSCPWCRDCGGWYVYNSEGRAVDKWLSWEQAIRHARWGAGLEQQAMRHANDWVDFYTNSDLIG